MEYILFLMLATLFVPGEAITCYTCTYYKPFGLTHNCKGPYIDELLLQTCESSQTNCVTITEVNQAQPNTPLRVTRRCGAKTDNSIAFGSCTTIFQDNLSIKSCPRSCNKDACNSEQDSGASRPRSVMTLVVALLACKFLFCL